MVSITQVATRWRLNEVDRFMLSIDRTLRSRTMRGNVCVLALEVSPGSIGHEQFKQLANHSFANWLHSLRLRRTWNGLYEWRVADSNQLQLPSVRLKDRSFQDLIAQSDIDPAIDPPFQISRCKTDRSEHLLFLWHHSLFDAAGGEDICLQVLRGDSIEIPQLVSEMPSSGQWLRNTLANLCTANEVRKRILLSGKAPLSEVARHSSNSGQGIEYHRIVFNKQETEMVSQHAEAQGLGLFRSIHFLTASTGAVSKLLVSRGAQQSDFLVPVPHNRRASRKLTTTPGNQLSFFFFRPPFLDEKCSAVEAAHRLLESAEDFIRNEFHRHCRSFFRLLIHLPENLYRRIIELPTRGRYASFYLSDIGESCSQFFSLSEWQILDAVHYPPNFSPPGLTFVFSRCREQLSVMIVLAAGLLSNTEILELQQSLRNELLGNDGCKVSP